MKADKQICSRGRISFLNSYFRGLRMTPPARRMLVAGFLLGVAAVPARAASEQGPPPRWWKSEATVRELGLTADQSARIDQIFETTVVDLRQEWEELDRLEEKLSKLFQNDADETTLARQIDRVETARASANKTRSLMLMRMRKVLTPEQRVRLENLSRRRDNRGPSSGARPAPPPGNRPPAAPERPPQF
jgi:Spy/CpxP family protein refolding chaperone